MNNYIYYAPKHPIAYKHLFDGCLEKYGVYAHFSRTTESDLRYLTTREEILEHGSCIEVIPVSPRNAEFRAKEDLSHEQKTFMINALELQFGTTLSPYKPLSRKQETAAGPIFQEVNKEEIEPIDQLFYKRILLSMLSNEYSPTEHDPEIAKFRIAMACFNASPEMIYPENYENLLKQINEQWRAERSAEYDESLPF